MKQSGSRKAESGNREPLRFDMTIQTVVLETFYQVEATPAGAEKWITVSPKTARLDEANMIILGRQTEGRLRGERMEYRVVKTTRTCQEAV